MNDIDPALPTYTWEDQVKQDIERYNKANQEFLTDETVPEIERTFLQAFLDSEGEA